MTEILRAGAAAEASEELPPDQTPAAAPTGKRLTRRQLLVRRFLRNKPAVAGLIIIGLLVLLAIVGPLISPWAYAEVDNRSFLKPPSARHFLGTTQAGRDVLALVLRGLGKSLIIGFSVAILSTSIAAIVGSFAANFGGWFQRISLWIIDLLLVIPSFLLIAVLMSPQGGSLRQFFGLNGSRAWIMLVILLAAFGWMLSARVVRSISMSVKEREYVHAAKFMGIPAPLIIFRHILPNISSLLIIDASLNVGGAILAETFLAFFGFGIQSPDTSLGTLISEGQRMATTFPWIFIAPAVILTVLVMSVNAVGDGLRDALDPNSQAGGSAK